MNKDKFIGMEVNGFRWFSYYKGIHSFQKKSEDGYRWELVQCEENQIYNGDLKFMTEHGLTLGKERQREVRKSFDLKKELEKETA